MIILKLTNESSAFVILKLPSVCFLAPSNEHF